MEYGKFSASFHLASVTIKYKFTEIIIINLSLRHFFRNQQNLNIMLGVLDAGQHSHDCSTVPVDGAWSVVMSTAGLAVEVDGA